MCAFDLCDMRIVSEMVIGYISSIRRWIELEFENDRINHYRKKS
jgi:hypothetical protein